jgi:hypothetical protein
MFCCLNKVELSQLQIIRTPVASWQQDTSSAAQNELRGDYGFWWRD